MPNPFPQAITWDAPHQKFKAGRPARCPTRNPLHSQMRPLFQPQVSGGGWLLCYTDKFWINLLVLIWELPGYLSSKEFICQWRCGFNPWVGKTAWGRKWELNPVFLPGEFQGQRTLEAYSPYIAKSLTWLSMHTHSPLRRRSLFMSTETTRTKFSMSCFHVLSKILHVKI